MGRIGGKVRQQCWGRDLLSLPAKDPGFVIINPSGSDQTVAMLNGEDILILPKGMSLRRYRYQLGAHPQATLLPPPTQDDKLTQQLQAYLQTATNSLLGNTAGVEDSPSSARVTGAKESPKAIPSVDAQQ